MERRELFSFLSSSVKDVVKEKEPIRIRPPYFNDEDAFDKGCQECDGRCATLCQEQVIIIGEDKTPFLDFSKSGCTYCDDCATACEFGVLNIADKQLINVDVVIDTKSCMSWDGVMCFSCKDPCLEDAIEFKAMFMPTINQDKCTSCGFCISRCPSYAIHVKENK
ncbi:ferredoxin-type protein NapF [Sulfurimonas sp.]|uniref:ferredoxin-type protein NapF n=1 Tax=Sulfurimonas sp. TaxID=2022749 RepID=UPI00262A4EB2|nr:ferredoxin-type protein NapF [Sulfurimonas sp.]